MDPADRNRIRALRKLADSYGPGNPGRIPAGTNATSGSARATAHNASCGDRAVIVSDGQQVWQESEGCIVCRAASAVAVKLICGCGLSLASAELAVVRNGGESAAAPEFGVIMQSLPAGRIRCVTLALDAAQELVASLTGR